MVKKKITYGLNHLGRPIGQHHHRAKLSDADVELIRDLHEAGLAGYRSLAQTFGVNKSTIRDICQYRIRATTPEKYVTVEEDKLKRPPPKNKDVLLQGEIRQFLSEKDIWE